MSERQKEPRGLVGGLVDRLRGQGGKKPETARITEPAPPQEVRLETRGALRTLGVPDPLDRRAWELVRDRGNRHGLEVLTNIGDVEGLRRIALERLVAGDFARAQDYKGKTGEEFTAQEYNDAGRNLLASDRLYQALHAFDKAGSHEGIRDTLSRMRTFLVQGLCDFNLYCQAVRQCENRELSQDEVASLADEALENSQIYVASAAFQLATKMVEREREEMGEAKIRYQNDLTPAQWQRLADAKFRKIAGLACRDVGHSQYVELTSLYRAAGDKDGLEKVAQLFVELGEWQVARNILEELGKPPDQAWYLQVAQKKPLFSRYYVFEEGGCTEELILLGDSFLSQHRSSYYDIDLAKLCYRAARHLPGFQKVGDVYREVGNFIEAAACYKEARYKPQDAEFYLQLGDQLVSTNDDTTKAHAAYHEYVRLSGDRPPTTPSGDTPPSEGLPSALEGTSAPQQEVVADERDGSGGHHAEVEHAAA